MPNVFFGIEIDSVLRERAGGRKKALFLVLHTTYMSWEWGKEFVLSCLVLSYILPCYLLLLYRYEEASGRREEEEELVWRFGYFLFILFFRAVPDDDDDDDDDDDNVVVGDVLVGLLILLGVR